MKALRKFWRRLVGSLAGGRHDDELARELESHVQLMTDDLVGRGASPEGARRQALLALGGMELATERYRDQRGLPSLDALGRDLRLVVRALRRTPALALLVVLTLGLAVGVNTTIFSLIDRVALRPLPVEKPDELVLISALGLPGRGLTFSAYGSAGPRGMDYPLVRALREGTTDVFGGTAVFRGARVALSLDAGTVELFGEFVNHDYFRVYNLRALAGRTITSSEDERSDAPPVAVLNHAFWMQTFGGDRSIVNRTIRLNDVPVTVVGVLAPGYSGSNPSRVPQVFLPLAAAATVAPFRLSSGPLAWDSPALGLYTAVARLRSGVDRERAERVLRARHQMLVDDAVAGGAALSARDRELYATRKAALFPAGTVGSLASRRSLDVPLRLLLGMTALVLLVAAGNVAAALLARNAARAHEVSVSYALGAGRWHLLRPLLLESLLLATTASAVGLLLANWVGGLVPTLFGLESELAGISTAPDRRVVAFTVTVSTAAAVLIWLASALTVTRRGSRDSLVPSRPFLEGGRATRPLRWVLVVGQVALSLALLCTSVLFARSLLNVLSVDPGFDSRSLMAFSVSNVGVAFDSDRRQQFVTALVADVRGIAGVTHATTSSVLPLSGGLSEGSLHGPRQAEGHAAAALADIASVGPDFFATMGLPLLEGRALDERDVREAPRVAVVNEALARLLVDRGSPVGEMIGFEHTARDTTVVGIVRDVRTRSFKSSAMPTLFLPAAQVTGADAIIVLARTATPSALTAGSVVATVKRLDPSVVVTEVRSVNQIARDRLMRERMLAGLSILFAALSAALAVMGLVGVASFSAASRAREIAIRLVLGASRARIAGMVLGEVGLLALTGSLLGLGAFLAANGILESLLFEVSADDPATIAGTGFALTVAAMLAGLRPARRAARLDPAATLRAE